MKNAISYAILSAPPLIAIAAFSLESRYTYGIQDRGLARHRKKFRVIGRASIWVSLLVFVFMTISLIRNP